MADLPILELTKEMMMAGAPEPEVELATDLKHFGCPYGQDDPRVQTWLDGFKAGLLHGGEVAQRALVDEFRERGVEQ